MIQVTEQTYEKLTGLIADSHGDMNALSSAIKILISRGAEDKIHLGDIFDSLSMDRQLHPMIRMLNAHQVNPVKGNNDYQVEKQLSNGYFNTISVPEREEILSYLNGMPMMIVKKDICFTHSLPYDTIRSFYEPVDTGCSDRAREIFEHTPYRLIFCGHSHAPILFRWREGKVTREELPDGRWLRFWPDERYIVIVGSAENRECGLLGADAMHYQRITIKPAA